MKTPINFKGVPQANPACLAGNMPRFGKVAKEREVIVYPVDEIDYLLDGCPVTWLNACTAEEAIAYYQKNFPLLPDDVLVKVAINDLKHKLAVLIKRGLWPLKQ